MGRSLWFRKVFCFISLALLSTRAYAFTCTAGANYIDFNHFVINGAVQQTFYIDINAISLSKAITDIELTDMSTYASCHGSPNSTWQDALRTTSLTLSSSQLSGLGFQVYLDAGGTKSDSPLNVCTWPDNNCSISTAGDAARPIIAKISIKRVSGSGDWSAGTIIPVGTEIARMKSQVRAGFSGNGTNFFDAITWVFRLKTAIIIPAYTCSITQYDKNVALPAVKRSDIVNHGTGRYPNAKKEFKFNLDCEPQTAVSVTFEGDTLSGTGTDSVLENKFTGNDNVGVQLLFDDSTPVKMTEKLQVATSAQATQLLSFNAYYYYNGGDINGGPVKANATFTFDYQ